MKIAIIGAGVTGMAAAWDLVRAGHEVTIYEAESAVGGLAGGFRDDKWAWSLEKFYHHWFQSDVDVLKLAEEMGVRDQILFPRPKTSFWIDGKILRSEISPSALFLPLSLIAKLRFGAVGAFVKLFPFWKPLERVTADAFFLRFMGEEAYGKFFRPLLIGKFGEQYDKVNMAWMWARVKSRTLRLGIFTGGFQAFLDTMAKAITDRGAKICLNTPVDKIELVNMQPTLTIKGEQHSFDRVLTTTSPKLLLKMAPALANTNYGDQAANLSSIGALCVILATKQQLLTDGTYWLNLPANSPDKKKSRFPFLALVEHTNWMDKANYGGDHLLYLGDYVPANHEYFRLTDEEVVERFIAALPTINPSFSKDWIRKAWVFRAPYAQPVPYINHSEDIPALQTPLPGVFWGSMSQVYPWDRGTNYAVRMGREIAHMMLK
jgi:protoporphyrinogen oxidase